MSEVIDAILVRKLRRIIVEHEEEICRLKQALHRDIEFNATLALNRVEKEILGPLYSHPNVTYSRARLANIIYSDRDVPPCDSVIRVHIYMINKKLRAINARVLCKAKDGYFLPKADAQKLAPFVV